MPILAPIAAFAATSAGAATIGAGIGAAGAIGGSLIASSGAKKAAATQEQASRDAQASNERMLERQIGLQEPFRQGGLTAQAQIMNLLGLGAPPSAAGATVDVRQNPQAYGLREINIPSIFGSAPQSFYLDAQGNTVDDIEAYAAQNPISAPAPAGGAPPSEFGSLAKPFGMEQFQQDPGYAFRQSEGMKALERSAAARGGLLSGGTLKGIQRFGQDLASQEYGNAFNRYQAERAARLNPLQSLMGSGQSSANTLTSAIGQAGQNEAANLYNAGQARASGYVGSANALGGALSSIGQAASSYPLYQAQIDYLKRAPAGSLGGSGSNAMGDIILGGAAKRFG
jgi:hypothetical protein